MSNSLLLLFTWSAFTLHIIVGLAVLRRWSELPLLAIINLITALGVLCYWVPRWYSYAFNGITWYATDQLIPLYAIGVCVLSICVLSGRFTAIAPQWIVFSLHTVVLLGAALFFTFFKMDRLF